MTTIRYSDYHGPQGDDAVIDGRVVEFDEDVARQMAHQAHRCEARDERHQEQQRRAA